VVAAQSEADQRTVDRRRGLVSGEQGAAVAAGGEVSEGAAGGVALEPRREAPGIADVLLHGGGRAPAPRRRCLRRDPCGQVMG
jgi:hypothetical protein